MNSRPARRYAGGALNFLLALVIISGLFSWQPFIQIGQAQSILSVNSELDRLSNDGLCTLREAVIAANKNQRSGSKAGECLAGSRSAPDIIEIPAGMTVTLTRTDNGREDTAATGDLDIKGNLTIRSLGRVAVMAEPGFTDRIFHILGGKVTLQGFTISGGRVNGDGGGIYSRATLSLDGMTFAANRATGNGGGVAVEGGKLVIKNSTLSGNAANGSGGGLFNRGTATLNNVTITLNTADSDRNNSGSGGGAAHSGPKGSIRLQNTILDGNLALGADGGPDCSGNLTSLGYNLVNTTAGCAFAALESDLTGVSAALGPLQDHGGPTDTHLPADSSPAVDAGNPAAPGGAKAACEAVDQRGVNRPQGAACDIGAVETGRSQAARLLRAFITSGGAVTVVGRIDGLAETAYRLQFYTIPSLDADCNVPAACAPVGTPAIVTTDADGDAIFILQIDAPVSIGQLITARTQDPKGLSSDYSTPVRVGLGNDSWPHAYRLDVLGGENATAAADDYIELTGQSRWYKFRVAPGSRVVVTLTGLPANYDLTLYKDIAAAFDSVRSVADLERLGAEFAPDAFTPDAFTGDVFSPDAFTPDAFTPDAFTPDAFTPDAFTPDAFTPDAFTPDAFTPDAFTPDAFTPDAFTPDAFTPDAFTPDAFTPDAFTPDAFTSAQTRSLIAISAFDGLVSEGISLNTWDSAGDFYVRVRGRNGAFHPGTAFHLTIRQIEGVCSDVSAAGLPEGDYPAEAGGYQTVILTDLSRMEGTAQEKADLSDRLAAFAERAEVAGVVVDLAQDDRVAAAYAQADAHPACPAAMNLTAQAARQIVERFRLLNPAMEYILIVGNDQVVPFFRHPDHALLASEKNFVPPVLDRTASQASLRLGYVLTQDDYGSGLTISNKEDDAFPIPSLAVGRLVETAADANGMLDAYMQTDAGLVEARSALVTAYDFLEDAGLAVRDELQAGLGPSAVVDSLITPRHLAPTDPSAWSAADLSAALLGNRHDITFLAGHFSAGSALAADFTTRLLASDLVNSSVDLTNALVFSAGCHAGYNIVDAHGVPNLTRQPDWAQAFARKRATLIAGTGYQYGDTDFIKYSEQLYLEFSRQLRVGSQPVAVGQALVRAKQAYLAGNPYLRGIDEKAVLEATLFGFPMLRMDLAGERLDPQSEPSAVGALNGYTVNPGAALDLRYFDLSVQPDLERHDVILDDVTTAGQTAEATYFSGSNGEVSKPNEPTLPLELLNVSAAGAALRGVGFRAASYSDVNDALPLTGASATEIRGVHTPFLTNVFFPTRLWTTNYFDALANDDGLTRLALIPGQYISESPASTRGTLRSFDEMDLRLFYSSYVSEHPAPGGHVSRPALAAAPAIVAVTSEINGDGVDFSMRLAGNPAAGIQEVWVTYTGLSGALYGRWESLDLHPNADDSTVWEGRLELNGFPAPEVRFFVQAVNGVGLVSMDTNQGRYYTPGMNTGPTQATTLQFTAAPASGRYSTLVTFSARLESNGTPLAGQAVAFGLGSQSRVAITGADGVASARMSIIGQAGMNDVRASFAGAGDYQSSYATSAFTILKQDTQIDLGAGPGVSRPNSGPASQADLITATLTDVDNRRLGEETLIFVISGKGGTYSEAVITDYAGRARLGNLPLPSGVYTLTVYFSGAIPSLGVNLSDERYNPAQLMVKLKLIGRATR